MIPLQKFVFIGENFKAIYRLAKAQIALKEVTAAIETLENALEQRSSEEQQPQQQGQVELQKLLETAHAYQLRKSKNLENATAVSKLKTLKTHANLPNDYTPSIREFQVLQELGEGNYSRVVSVKHVVTKEHFALKIIEKKKCEDLAKRQHPNVWNEIEMEKKILGQRLWREDEEDDTGNKRFSWCRRIVQLFHTFQDYG